MTGPRVARPSLDIGTKLVRPQPGWRFVLYPTAGEGGGSFQGSRDARPSGRSDGPLADSRADAARRARGKLRRYCAANRLNRLGTLTYAGTGCHDPRALRADVADFFRGLRGRVGQPFAYLWVPEWHKTDHGLHVHFAVGRFIPVGLIRAVWGHGFVDIRMLNHLPAGSGTLGEARKAAGYLAKYVGKDFSRDSVDGLHRYEVAQGFQPRSRTVSGSSAADVLDQASMSMGAAPEAVWHSRDEDAWVGPPAVWARWG